MAMLDKTAETEKATAVKQVVAASLWQGPLPPPDCVKAYEAILPGSMERMLSLAEKETQIRHEQVKLDHERDHAYKMEDLKVYDRRVRNGQYLAAFVSLCFLAGAVICAFLGQASIGVAIAGVTIVGIVKSLVDQRRAK